MAQERPRQVRSILLRHAAVAADATFDRRTDFQTLFRFPEGSAAGQWQAVRDTFEGATDLPDGQVAMFGLAISLWCLGT